MDKLTKHPYLAYSIVKDGVYCLPCRLFPTDNERGPQTSQLVTDPFRDWKRLHSKVKDHVGGVNSAHANCMVGVNAVLTTIN